MSASRASQEILALFSEYERLKEAFSNAPQNELAERLESIIPPPNNLQQQTQENIELHSTITNSPNIQKKRGGRKRKAYPNPTSKKRNLGFYHYLTYLPVESSSIRWKNHRTIVRRMCNSAWKEMKDGILPLSTIEQKAVIIRISEKLKILVNSETNEILKIQLLEDIPKIASKWLSNKLYQIRRKANNNRALHDDSFEYWHNKPIPRDARGRFKRLDYTATCDYYPRDTQQNLTPENYLSAAKKETEIINLDELEAAQKRLYG